MTKTNLVEALKPLNAKRLQKSVKATVQSTGRLTFAMDAVKDMALSEEKSIIIFNGPGSEKGDLYAVLSEKGDANAFVLKRCGAYFYITFKNYLQQSGVDYKNNTIVYDITELDEKYEGKSLYKFECRQWAKKNAKPTCDKKSNDQTPEGETPSDDVSDAPEPDQSAIEEVGADDDLPPPTL